MLPVTESAYENEAFRGETAKKEKNKVTIQIIYLNMLGFLKFALCIRSRQNKEILIDG